MPYLIDTHCHLSFFDEREISVLIANAKNSGVKKLISVGCNLKETKACINLAEKYKDVFATAGIHPTDLGVNIVTDLYEVEELSKSESVSAIGEIGLDYYHDKFPRDLQQEYLIKQLLIAKKIRKPVILHSRASKFAGSNSSVFPDIIDCIKKADYFNAVMHCFSGNKSEADMFLSMGLMLSFTGIITYERNEELRQIIKTMPIERLMLETDSPFLPPKKYKGKRNEPAFIIETSKEVASIRNISLEEVIETTSKNAERFFRI